MKSKKITHIRLEEDGTVREMPDISPEEVIQKMLQAMSRGAKIGMSRSLQQAKKKASKK